MMKKTEKLLRRYTVVETSTKLADQTVCALSKSDQRFLSLT